MAKLYHQEDCNLSLLDGKTVAIIGYSQNNSKYPRYTPRIMADISGT